ncbi:AAA family ATPase [Deinococcus sp.]|uniref:AAA family ATPase n=1 Tax=Deinococcus sp. TaxID=47478 RepID=UPI003CC5BB4B
MALKEIDLHAPLNRIEFLVPDLIPFGYFTFLGAREGVGKTTLLTGLAWQMTRPAGGEFIGRAVPPGPVVYLNTDAADGQSRPVRFWLEQHQATFPDGDMNGVTVLENTGAGLSPEEFRELLTLAESKQARCIIIDSFMGTFPGIDGNRLDAVMLPMLALRDFAARTGAAVIVTDHLPKKAVGEREGDRGIMGSTGKTAQARAVLLLTRAAPKDVGGLDVLSCEVRKNSFARSGYSFGLEVQRTFDEEDRALSVHLVPYDLPEEERSNTGSARATAAVVAHLEGSGGEQVQHAALLSLAIERGNIRERMAKEALGRALGLLGGRLEEIRQPGKGAPKAYRLKPDPETHCTIAPNALNAVQDGVLFGAVPGCTEYPAAPNAPEEGEEIEGVLVI